MTAAFVLAWPANASSPAKDSVGTAGSSNVPSWLSGYRRLTLRYERRSDTLKAFLALATMLVCFKRLQKTK